MIPWRRHSVQIRFDRPLTREQAVQLQRELDCYVDPAVLEERLWQEQSAVIR